MPTTTNYGWTTPADTDLVKDGASAIRTLGNSIDSTLKTQIDAQIPDNLLTTKGDIIAATAASTPARLGVGANDTVLTADSSTATGLKWGTVAQGGMTQLATGSLSGASVTLSSISGSYIDLKLVIKNFKPATDNASLYLRFNADSTANRHSSFANGAAIPFDSTFCQVSEGNDNSVANGLIVLDFYNYANTTTYKSAESWSITTNATATTQFNFYKFNFFYNQLSAITSLQIYPSAGNFTSGDYILYGVK